MSDLTEALEVWGRLHLSDANLNLIKDAARRWAALDTEETREAIAGALYEKEFGDEWEDEVLYGTAAPLYRQMADTVLAVLKDSPDV
jgi:hypothetical protein